MDFAEAEALESGYQLSGAYIVEESGKGAAQHGNDFFPARQQAPGVFDAVGDHLRLLGADPDALAAADAALIDDLSPVFLDLYRLDRTVSDAGITFAAALFDGLDRTHDRSWGEIYPQMTQINAEKASCL
jgi:hypothetical protein